MIQFDNQTVVSGTKHMTGEILDHFEEFLPRPWEPGEREAIEYKVASGIELVLRGVMADDR